VLRCEELLAVVVSNIKFCFVVGVLGVERIMEETGLLTLTHQLWLRNASWRKWSERVREREFQFH
jgi:hypothetical protein